jgi:hypothetical protein
LDAGSARVLRPYAEQHRQGEHRQEIAIVRAVGCGRSLQRQQVVLEEAGFHPGGEIAGKGFDGGRPRLEASSELPAIESHAFGIGVGAKKGEGTEPFGGEAGQAKADPAAQGVAEIVYAPDTQVVEDGEEIAGTPGEGVGLRVVWAGTVPMTAGIDKNEAVVVPQLIEPTAILPAVEAVGEAVVEQQGWAVSALDPVVNVHAVVISISHGGYLHVVCVWL